MRNEISIDSGNGFAWAAIPSARRDYKHEIDIILSSHLPQMTDFEVLCLTKSFIFYAYRILACYKYGLVQGREILKMVCRCAFNDSTLTDDESICIIDTCHDPRLDNILMEVNYNAGW